MDEVNQSDPIIGSRALPTRFVTLYRIATLSFPGLIGILMALDSLEVILPGMTPDASGGPQDVGTGWATAAFWLVALLASFPAGLAISALGFFSFGYIIFSLKVRLIRSRLMDRILIPALGEPTDLGTIPPQQWTKTIHSLESIVNKSLFRGPRSDDPESILAAAILLRGLAFLLFIAGPLYHEWLWSAVSFPENLLRLILGLLVVVVLCLVSAGAEVYREYSIGITADSICSYPELAGHAGPKLKRAILDIRARAAKGTTSRCQCPGSPK